MDEKTVALVAKDGSLYFAPTGKDAIDWHNGEDVIVLYRYPAGDADTFRWPLETSCRTEEKQREQIAVAMSDARECGDIAADIRTATLPDGSTIELM
jgi:hypothetical protein